jgi:predicted aspartyl protease
VDTGFDGGLIAPLEEALRLGLPDEVISVELGDGSSSLALAYRAVVTLEGLEGFRVIASILCLGTEYVLGREVIDKLRICFHHGERLEVELKKSKEVLRWR